MQKRIGHIIIVLILVTIAILITTYTAPAAQAHTVTPTTCRVTTLTPVPTNVGEWRKRYRRCLGYAATHNARHACRLPDRPIVPKSVTVKHEHASTLPGRSGRGRQRQVITEVLNVGRRKGARPKVMIAGIAGMTAESSAQELHHGHGTSLGPFQIIDSWGPARNRIDATWSAQWFFSAAIIIDRRRPYLSVGGLAQAVERSAHPGAYSLWVPEARRTYRLYLGPCSR